MDKTQALVALECLVNEVPFPEDEPTTWCTCDDCLSLDRRLRGACNSDLLSEPLVLLSLSPSVLTSSALRHFLPALMLGSMSHGFGSDELRRGVAFELMTQPQALELLDKETHAAAIAFLRWVGSIEESRGLIATDYVEAARQLESTGRLESAIGFAVTW